MNIGSALENAEFQALPPAPFEVTFHNPPPELAEYSHEDPKTMFTVVSCTLLNGKRGPDVLIKLLGISGMIRVDVLDFRFHPIPPTECLPRTKLKMLYGWRAPLLQSSSHSSCDTVINRPRGTKPLIPGY